MKNKIAILLTLSLIGCASLQFDPVEYDRYITVKMISDSAYAECGKPEVVDSINKMSELIGHQYVYTSNRSGRTQITNATTEMAGLISSLQLRYKGTPPSIGYCQEKLKNISAGTTTIVQTLGKM